MNTKKMLTIREVGYELGVCYASALEWVKSSGISYMKVGRTYRVSVDDFNNFINASTKSQYKPLYEALESRFR